MSILPAHWTSFVQRNNLTGKEIEISEKDDLSGVGAVFTIMSVSDAEDEATKFFPE